MHLLAATPGVVDDGSQAVDLGQSPADIVILSSADSELTCLAVAHRQMPDSRPGLRLASLLYLGHPLSVDLYVEQVIAHARIVIVRLLGGKGYWAYGVDEISLLCRRRGIPVIFLPGEDQPDNELMSLSTVDGRAWHRCWQYLVQGGTDNAGHLLRYAACLAELPGCADPDHDCNRWQEPVPLPPAGLWQEERPEEEQEDEATSSGKAAVVAIVFYRALVQAANTEVIHALCAALRRHGLQPLPLFVTSLKDPLAAGIVESLLAATPPAVILNATAFAVASPERLARPAGQPGGNEASGGRQSPFLASDCPVLQVVFSGGSEAEWENGSSGLSARDMAMNVALPEVDGRILSRAVSFKAAAQRNTLTESDVVFYRPRPDRVDFVARMAAGWARLRQTPRDQRTIGLVLSNYPNRDGRIGNGVGLDTPQSAVSLLSVLAEAGYSVTPPPVDGQALMHRLTASGHGEDEAWSTAGANLYWWPLDCYRSFLASLPDSARQAIHDRWGEPEDDPSLDRQRQAFALRLLSFGNVWLGIQPPRCSSDTPLDSYHDLTVPPPHGYLAFYGFLRQQAGCHALIHLGKHGTLEWLPGKALALGASCFPELVLGPLPHLYPFIVNDPGEGSQAKRRAQAVIIDHLTPPLTRADSYGPLKDLEALVDEYYEAAGVDRRRLEILRQQILDLARRLGLDRDVGISDSDDDDQALMKIDSHLCELKELQIRDGLHVFGHSPQGELKTDLLVALARVPGSTSPSLHRSLARDLGLELDPLDCAFAEAWNGPRPAILQQQDDQPWRTSGDTVERLERLARALVEGTAAPDDRWTETRAALELVEHTLRPAVESCGDSERNGLLAGLDGRFVPPAPSGAPTRGRPDVLPTGRNFYSVDTRVVPTPAAWALGWKSAGRLLDRYAQEHGDWPRHLALTAWGTANMRTGGDDIAQGLALMGVRPTWDKASRRVTGFEILPASVLGRPRVDVTLRISGFFRDAFPAQIDLFDSAARAVAALDEPDETNPLAAAVRRQAAALCAASPEMDSEEARRQAGHRVFGAMPGAYGAGLQTLIDERGWDNGDDLARAYLAWGGFAYGNGQQGTAARQMFSARLADVELVVHNQDNREHDLLDSDEYSQFEGGLAAAVRLASGGERTPEVYHADHSAPDTPRIRTLREEIARIVRGRATNPKWIAGVMRHGYKGAVEMAATVDYLFAFQATARCVEDHHFEAIFDAWLGDPDVLRFLQEANPAALREMATTFDQAQRRRLWKPRRNSVAALLDELLS